MKTTPLYSNSISWFFGTVVFVLGILNLVLIHPVPGIVYLLVSFLFIPALNNLLRKQFGVAIPFVAKVVLFVVIIWFTLGISDLAEVYGI